MVIHWLLNRKWLQISVGQSANMKHLIQNQAGKDVLLVNELFYYSKISESRIYSNIEPNVCGPRTDPKCFCLLRSQICTKNYLLEWVPILSNGYLIPNLFL